jgi:hypothetical protein
MSAKYLSVSGVTDDGGGHCTVPMGGGQMRIANGSPYGGSLRTYQTSGFRLQAAWRWTSQTVVAMSSSERASSHPPSIHWNGQNRLAG